MSEHVIDRVPAPGAAHALRNVPGVAVVLVLLTSLFAMISPDFATLANLTNVLPQSVILLLLALPMTFIIMTEGIDLSVGAMLTLLTIVYAMVIQASSSIPLALCAALAAGLAYGFANGAMIALLGVPPFVVTLGTLGVGQGLSLVLTDGQSIVQLPSAVQFAYSGAILGVPVPILVAAACYAVMHVLLHHTRFGVCVAALGGNREALCQAGVDDKRVLTCVYMLGGLMVAVAAPLLCGRMSAAHPTAAIGMEFDAIAAVAVGGTQFERGNGTLLGSLLGVIAIGILRNGLNLLSVPSSVQVACVGCLVIFAMLIDGLRTRLQ